MSAHTETYLNAAMYWLGHIARSLPEHERVAHANQMHKVFQVISPHIKSEYEWLQIFSRVAQYYLTRSQHVYGTIMTPAQVLAVAYHLTDVVNNDCTVHTKYITNVTNISIPHFKRIYLETVGYKVFINLSQMSHMLSMFVSQGQNPIVA
ncbi:hypothetical protein BCR44DRAFT_23401 [Catenaria anguillulae PL171]|uniref:Uncharacterized protein n=1 Tax=Catenaria anguillulae PL171 TaxID=765915 RepID=A0A1Y2H5U1_9FUNG|nr:hypothetical protein BCR44DRAFT_23401 [Catenaria anguillulae PL171]